MRMLLDSYRVLPDNMLLENEGFRCQCSGFSNKKFQIPSFFFDQTGRFFGRRLGCPPAAEHL